jgi:hypothetical protein
MSITTTNSLCKKIFSSELNENVLKNGTHLRKYLINLPYTYTQKLPLA